MEDRGEPPPETPEMSCDLRASEVFGAGSPMEPMEPMEPIGSLHSPMEHVGSLRTLSDNTPTHMRGVPVRYLLRGAGRHFASSEVSKSDGAVSSLARPCSRYAAFISHDWKTSRVLKFFSLLVLYNAQAAAVSTFLVSSLGGILISCKLVPDSDFAFAMGFLNFIVVFLFWQNIRDLVLQPQVAFLDKLCIPQDDETLKNECILGLAGYLRVSQKLVILWSERYFRRLWCIYEVAAFLRANPRPGAVCIVPVTMPLLLLLHCSWWFLARTCLYLMWHKLIGTEANRTMLVSAALAVAFVVTFPLQSRAGMHLSHNLNKLTAQLGQFNIHRTECSCCSTNHRHSRTGAIVHCDRELVYQTLAKWHGKDDDPEDRSLDLFSQTVRSQLAGSILHAWGSSAVPLRFFAYTFMSTQTPFLFRAIPDFVNDLSENNIHGLQAVVCGVRHLLGWATMAPCALFYLWICMKLWRHSPHPQWPALAEAASMILTLVVLSVVWGAMGLPLLLQDPYSLVALIPFLLLGGISIWLLTTMEQIPAQALAQEVGPPAKIKDLPNTKADLWFSV